MAKKISRELPVFSRRKDLCAKIDDFYTQLFDWLGKLPRRVCGIINLGRPADQIFNPACLQILLKDLIRIVEITDY
jgi:hypothetical protein